MTARPSPRIMDRRIVRFGSAVVIVTIALGLRLVIVHLLGRPLPPYLTFYPAVMCVAMFAGFWPSIVATALSALMVDFFILSPVGSFTILGPADVVGLVFFAGMGLLVSVLAERYRRSQKLLRDSAETQLELFVEYAPAALAMFDRQMRYMRASRRWMSDYGLGDRDLTGESHYSVFPEVPVHWKEIHRRALTGEVVKSEADRFERADGSTQWIRWEIHPWKASGGGIGGILIFTEDITERKRTEEQLQRLARTYVVLTDINQTIVREKDQTAMLAAACRIAVDKGNFRMAWIGMIDPVTRSVKSITSSGDVDGYLTSVGVGSSDERVLSGPATRCFRSAARVVYNDIETDPDFQLWAPAALQRGYRSLAAFPIRQHDEVLGVFVLYAGEPGFFDEPELALLDEMAMDISFAMGVAQHESERRKVEEELRWRTAFFEAQMESSADGIMVKDDKGEVIFRNRRFFQMWGLPETLDADSSKRLALAFSKVKHPERLASDTANLYAHPDQTSHDEIELLDGTLLTRFTSPVKDCSGRSYGRLWVFQDITERRQLEQQLRQSQKMEAVGQLTGGIAHDFNNLLGIVVGNLDLLQMMLAGNEAALVRVHTAQVASQRGADVTRRLLSFSRSGELKPNPTALNNSVQNVIGLARTIGPDIRFALQLDESVPVVLVDASGLENALLNLIVNARDAMHGGGTVTIATELRRVEQTHPLVGAGELDAGVHACILVSDTGHGMSNQVMERVFEPFFSTKQQGQGTGLGLAMVYGFVKQSGGAVRMYSEQGHGTTVTIYLPLSHADLPPEPVAAPAPADDHRSHRILVVDDEVDLVEIAEVYLQAMGHTVYRAEDAGSALKMVALHGDFDLLITDIVMPGSLNGVDLARVIREQIPGLRVIYSSGYPADAMADRGLPMIDGQLLRKPYQRLEFELAVRAAME